MNMVEQVARALCQAEGFKWEDQADAMTSASGGDNEQDHYLIQARAAIEAMREPTPEMMTKEDPVYFQGNCHMCGGHLEGWHGMIDKALDR